MLCFSTWYQSQGSIDLVISCSWVSTNFWGFLILLSLVLSACSIQFLRLLEIWGSFFLAIIKSVYGISESRWSSIDVFLSTYRRRRRYICGFLVDLKIQQFDFKASVVHFRSRFLGVLTSFQFKVLRASRCFSVSLVDGCYHFCFCLGTFGGWLWRSIVIHFNPIGRLGVAVLFRSKNLRTLKVFRCSGDWDKVLEMVTESACGLVEVHLERLQLGDVGLVAVSKCRSLEVLHILKTPDCSNLGLLSVAENCRGLRKVHIDGWKTNRINDEGLVGLSNYCINIQELVLIGVIFSRVGLEALGAHCVKLERLALCGSETVEDAENSCITEKCIALKKLCIKSCLLSNHGMEAITVGCPNLVKVSC